jgi:two-component system NtrC family response regulator
MVVEGTVIDIADLPETLDSDRTGDASQDGLLALNQVIYQHAQYAVEYFGGNRARAARAIGIGRATLYRLLAKGSPSEGEFE